MSHPTMPDTGSRAQVLPHSCLCLRITSHLNLPRLHPMLPVMMARSGDRKFIKYREERGRGAQNRKSRSD